MTSGRRRRRVAVVTGTRGEYGLLRSTMEAVQGHRDLTLQVVVTGMHLLGRFGRTVDAIVRDGWRIDARVKMQAGDDDALDQARGVSRGVIGIARFLEEAKTDVVVVLGDRIEALAGAVAAVTTGRFVAHLHGGDVAPGDVDDSLRNAITKLAHLHLTATRAARRRVIRLGEDPRCVYPVGASGLDRLLQLVRSHPRKRKPTNHALVVYHPCGRRPSVEKRVMQALLRAVDQSDLSKTIIYPNSDRGCSGIVEAIEVHGRRCRGSLRIVRSLERDDYLRALIEADVLVGNSSSGIIEAATAGTPAVNIGLRQHGRQRSGRFVVDAGETTSLIRAAINKALKMRPIMVRKSVYGDGHAGERVAELIAAMPLDGRSRRKIHTGRVPDPAT